MRRKALQKDERRPSYEARCSLAGRENSRWRARAALRITIRRSCWMHFTSSPSTLQQQHLYYVPKTDSKVDHDHHWSEELDTSYRISTLRDQTKSPSSQMPSSLPHEVVLEVIRGFRVPGKPSSYCLSRDSTSALLNMCCVSLAFKELAEPLLYSRVVMTPANLQAFFATILATREPDETRRLAHRANEKATLM